MLARWDEPVEEHCQLHQAHGRQEQRHVAVYRPPSYWLPPDWQDKVACLIKVERRCQHRRAGQLRTSVETAWWISTVMLPAAVLQLLIRGHWQIENQLHHVRDMALQEDACRTRTQPGKLACLRSMVLNCLRAHRVPSIARALYRNALNFELAVAMTRVPG